MKQGTYLLTLIGNSWIFRQFVPRRIIKPSTPQPKSIREINENKLETLLELTIMHVGSASIYDDLCVAAPWSLADVNDSFEDDINAVDNDGGRRTAYGMFHTTKDAVMAATEDDRTSSAWHNGLQRILEDQKGIGRRHNKSSVSRQRRRRQNLDNLMKLEVRIAVSHSLLGRVGLRLWAAVRRDYITMDQHLERCRTAMLSITDEMLWNLCSGRVQV